MGRDDGNVYAVVRQSFENSHAYLMRDFKRKSVLVQFWFATKRASLSVGDSGNA